MKFLFTIDPRKIGLSLGAVALLLACQSLISEFMIENLLGSDYDNPIVLVIDLFSVNAEETIPTWYSILLLFFAAALIALIAVAKLRSYAPFRRHWAGLAIIFLYLSIDEGAVIHEILSDPLQAAFNTTGFLAFGWQVAAIPLVILFGLVYLRFLFHLPPRIRNLFVLASVLYVGGALIVESISANQWYLQDGITFDYLAIATLEELLEMMGAVVLIYALLSYLVDIESVVIFQSPGEKANVMTSSTHSTRMQRYRRYLKTALLVGVVLIGLNAVLLSWALATRPISTTLAANDYSLADTFYNNLAIEDVLIARVPGRFEFNNTTTQQLATVYIELFAEVFVVSLPTAETTIVIAGDNLPFDQNGLTDRLQSSGLTQFVIFDGEAIRQLMSSF